MVYVLLWSVPAVVAHAASDSNSDSIQPIFLYGGGDYDHLLLYSGDQDTNERVKSLKEPAEIIELNAGHVWLANDPNEMAPSSGWLLQIMDRLVSVSDILEAIHMFVWINKGVLEPIESGRRKILSCKLVILCCSKSR